MLGVDLECVAAADFECCDVAAWECVWVTAFVTGVYLLVGCDLA